MSYSSMDIQTGSDKFITIKSGESAQLNILSKEPIKTANHWVNKKKIACMGKVCELCESGDQPRQQWKVQAIDRKDGKTKEFEFGTQIAIQIKELASILAESDQTIHDIDLRIKRTGATQFDTDYFVNQVPKKVKVDAGTAQEPNEEEVQF